MLGARFDMEVDAFLILVLSVYVAQSVGPWVLAIGAARYAVWAAGWVLPWMRTPVPPRYWRKPVAAIQGIVLTAAVADQLPGVAINIAIAVAMVLLAESFGRDVVWQWRQRRSATRRRRDPRSRSVGRLRGVTIVSPPKHREWPRSRIPPASDEGAPNGVQAGVWSEPATKGGETPVPSERGRLRAGAARVITALAVPVVWFSLIFPISSAVSHSAPCSGSLSRSSFWWPSVLSCPECRDG